MKNKSAPILKHLWITLPNKAEWLFRIQHECCNINPSSQTFKKNFAATIQDLNYVFNDLNPSNTISHFISELFYETNRFSE